MPCRVGPSFIPRLSCMGREKKKTLVYIAHAWLPQDYWEFGNFRKLCSVTQTSAWCANFSWVKDTYNWPHFVWTVTREQWRQSSLCLRELSMSFQLNATANDWLSWIKQCRLLLSRWYCFWPQNCLKVSITLQCYVAFQQVNRNFHNFSVDTVPNELLLNQHAY